MKFVIYSILVPNMVYWITYFVICEVFKMDSLVGAIVGSAATIFVGILGLIGVCISNGMNIYNKIYAHNLYYGFDYVDSIEWTIIIVITIFFMPATSRTISITLLALAIVNNILLFSFCRKTDKYKDDSKFVKILLAFSTCLFCCAMIIVIWGK